MSQGTVHQHDDTGADAGMDAGAGAGAGTDADGAAALARHARFGRLPDPVRVEDMVEERPAVAPDPVRHAYDPDEWLVRYCL